MKVEKQEYKVSLTKDEVNALLLGLSRLRNDKWTHNRIEYYGFGGPRQTHHTTIDELIQQFERL